MEQMYCGQKRALHCGTWWHVTLVLWLFLIGLLANVASGYSQESEESQSVSKVDRVFTDAGSRFSILVPADTEAIVPENNVDFAMRSRAGWIINIQSSPANPALSLSQMAARFESAYLGQDKPWTHKLSEELHGEEAYAGLYGGSGSRAQVIIKRTPSWDFVLMFMAPEDAFIRSMKVFQKVLSSFETHETVQPSGSVTASSPPDPGDDGAASSAAWELYRDNRMGFAISHPSQWPVSHPDGFTSVFSGAPDTDAGYVSVSIRNVAADTSVPYEARAEGMLQQLRAQMAYMDGSIRHEQVFPITVPEGDNVADGLQMVSTFKRGGIDYRQWTIVIPRVEGNVVHVWVYLSPLDRFAKYQTVAENMIGTLSLVPAATQ